MDWNEFTQIWMFISGLLMVAVVTGIVIAIIYAALSYTYNSIGSAWRWFRNRNKPKDNVVDVGDGWGPEEPELPGLLHRGDPRGDGIRDEAIKWEFEHLERERQKAKAEAGHEREMQYRNPGGAVVVCPHCGGKDQVCAGVRLDGQMTCATCGVVYQMEGGGIGLPIDDAD